MQMNCRLDLTAILQRHKSYVADVCQQPSLTKENIKFSIALTLTGRMRPRCGTSAVTSSHSSTPRLKMSAYNKLHIVSFTKVVEDSQESLFVCAAGQ